MRLERNLPYWLLVGGSAAWLALIWLAPWAASREWPGAGLFYAIFAPICHQKPDRSFVCFGHQLAACNRCVGLYVGFAAGLLMLPYLGRLREFLLRRSKTILFFFVPMAIDVALYRWNTPWSRFVTGWIGGFPVGLFVWAAAAQLYRQRFEPSQRAENGLSHAQ